MNFYYSPGVCSLASHIVLRESGLSFTAIRVDLSTHTFRGGSDYLRINPRGYVPLLELDDGRRMAEGPAILQYVADLVPEKGLAPAWGTPQRYRLVEWLAYISSELHKHFGPIFDPSMPEEVKQISRQRLLGRYEWLEQEIGDHGYLLGDTFSIADAYLLVVSSWGKMVGVNLMGFAKLQALLDRIAARPAVREALQAEGLV